MQLSTKLIIVWIIVFIGLVASSFSRSTASSAGDLFDILIHISIYSILAFIPILLFRKRIIAFMATIAIAPISIAFEFLHGIIAGDEFKNLDYAAYNNIGIIVGIIAAAIIRIKMHYGNESSI